MTQPCKVPCLICGKRLDDLGDGVGNHPDDGIEFTSPGHYGTRLFDPHDGTRLAVNLCDGCLEQKREEGRVLLVEPGRAEPPAYKLWTSAPETPSDEDLN